MMFNYNRKGLDKKAELFFVQADAEGTREHPEGQNWHKHAKVHNHMEMEGSRCCCTSNQFLSTGSDLFVPVPVGLLVHGFRDTVYHNPVWKQMVEVRRHESIVENIPGMELKKVNCKLTDTKHTKAKLKDGTNTVTYIFIYIYIYFSLLEIPKFVSVID